MAKADNNKITRYALIAALLLAVVAGFGNKIVDALWGGGEHVINSLGQPVDVSASAQPVKGNLYMYAFPTPMQLSDADLSQLDSLTKKPDDLHAWFAQRHAVPISNLYIDVDVRSRRSAEVKVKDVQLRTNCRPALTGTLFWSPSQGGEFVYGLDYNLDKPYDPPSYTVGKDGKIEAQGTDYFTRFDVTIEPGKSTTFKLHAFTANQYCEFSFMAKVKDGANIAEVPIDDHGAPFKVTGLAQTAQHSLDYSQYQTIYARSAGAPQSLWPIGPDGNKTYPELWMKADPKAYYY